MNDGYDKLIKTYEHYKRDLTEILEDKILEETAAELQNKVRKRIFTDGLDANGNIISGSYSTKPIVVKKDVFINQSAFNGKKTMKLQYGYKELRDIQGLKTDKVNLDYSGDLKEDLKVEVSDKSVVVGISKMHNLEKALNLEKKYQTKIFAFTENEIKFHLKNVIEKLRKAQKDFFHGR